MTTCRKPCCINQGFFFFFAFQIAAKIGGDGVNPPPVANEFAYGGQKRPLEDGGKFPVNLSLGTKIVPELS